MGAHYFFITNTLLSVGLSLKLGTASSIRFLIKVQRAAKENPVDIELDFP
jgi:hypothetical protein